MWTPILFLFSSSGHPRTGFQPTIQAFWNSQRKRNRNRILYTGLIWSGDKKVVFIFPVLHGHNSVIITYCCDLWNISPYFLDFTISLNIRQLDHTVQKVKWAGKSHIHEKSQPCEFVFSRNGYSKEMRSKFSIQRFIFIAYY